MKLEFGFSGPGRRNLIIGFVVLVILSSIIFIIFRSRSKYSYPDSSTSIVVNSTTTNLQDAIADCTTKYRAAIMIGQTDSNPSKAQCIQTAVNAYFSAKCPFIANGTAPSTTANPPQTQDQVNAYNQYSGSGTVTDGGDAGAITASTQYTSILANPTNGTTNAMILKARKADLTGPTRKYIATACSGFYDPADNTLPNLTSIYTGWKKLSSLPSTDYGFYPQNVTGPRIYEWALKAATPIVTSGSDIAADASGVSSTTRTVSVSPSFDSALAAGTKIKLQGVTYTGDISIASSPVSTTSTLYLSYSSQTFPAIPSGTVILKNTTVTINSIAVGGGNQTNLPLITQSSSPVTSAVLGLAGPLDDSLGVGSQVLLSGSSLTGAITISAYTTSPATVTISFNSQTFPLVPSGATIENALDIPYATPLITAPPPIFVKTDKAAGVSAGTSSGSITLNAAPATAIATGTTVTLPTIAFPGTPTITASSSGATITLTSSTSIVWPAIPAGTMIFSSTGQPITSTSGTTHTLYKAVGSLSTGSSSQKMINWQIAQIVGPGTNWPNGITWGTI